MLTYTIRGRAVYRYPPDVEIEARPGDLVLLRRETAGARGVRPTDRWDALWLRFDPWPEWRPAGFERLADGLYRRHLALEGLRLAVQEIWARIITAVEGRDAARALAAVSAIDRRTLRDEEGIQTELLALWIRELFLVARRVSTRTPRIDPRIFAALQSALADPAAPRTLAELAREADMSETWFAHRFREQLGIPPKRFLRLMRLRQAAVQLELSDDPVGEIAERTGFTSLFQLSRQFTQRYGVSPRAYRARHR
jgi:AraC family transcriptional regulator of arabinose operon